MNADKHLFEKYRKGLDWYRSSRASKARAEAVRRATPPWVDPGQIADAHEEARRVSKATGVKHCVDHYWPLDGQFVSGLNVPANLRIIPVADNSSKGNSWPVEHIADCPAGKHGRPGYIANTDMESCARIEGYMRSTKVDALSKALAEVRHGEASENLVMWLFNIPESTMQKIMGLPTINYSCRPPGWAQGWGGQHAKNAQN